VPPTRAAVRPRAVRGWRGCASRPGRGEAAGCEGLARPCLPPAPSPGQRRGVPACFHGIARFQGGVPGLGCSNGSVTRGFPPGGVRLEPWLRVPETAASGIPWGSAAVAGVWRWAGSGGHDLTAAGKSWECWRLPGLWHVGQPGGWLYW